MQITDNDYISVGVTQNKFKFCITFREESEFEVGYAQGRPKLNFLMTFQLPPWCMLSGGACFPDPIPCSLRPVPSTRHPIPGSGPRPEKTNSHPNSGALLVSQIWPGDFVACLHPGKGGAVRPMCMWWCICRVLPQEVDTAVPTASGGDATASGGGDPAAA